METNKYRPSDLGHNQTIRDAIKRIALQGVVKKNSNVVRNTARITGYVAKIHTDGDLAGTIDVQEYNVLSVEPNGDNKIGYHEGVFLSAMQDNSNGMVIIPKLYSEVTIVTDPETQTEYVSMYSHVDIIQMDSHSSVVVGVTEREEFDPDDEDSPDVHELKPTGVHAHTVYKPNSIRSDIQGEDSGNLTYQLQDDQQILGVVGSNHSSYKITQKAIELKHADGTLVIDDASNTMKFGASKVQVDDGVVYVGSDSNVDDAVLGGELAVILMDMLNYISQIKTTTQLGPQPPLNVAMFLQLKAKIQAFKNSHSGFLTNKVQIQK